MTFNIKWQRFALLLMFSIIGLASWLWTIRPEHGWNWLAAIVCLPLILGFTIALRRIMHTKPLDDAAKERLSSAFVGGSAIILLALVAALVDHYSLFMETSGDWSARVGRIIPGGILVAMANVIPKVATKNPKFAALLRFNAYVLFIVGLAYIGCYIFLPLDIARDIATWTMMGGVTIVMARTIWFKINKHRT